MNKPLSFELQATDGTARAGVLRTPRGEVPTPVFMPVGTSGSVKGVDPHVLDTIGASICLGNTYHLMNRPGAEQVQALGGLHKMMHWNRPILTDSGGFQVFSLASLRKVTDDGVVFRSHLDGALLELTPESAMDVQQMLGSDIMMPLDICPPHPCTAEEMSEALRLTTAWAKRSVEARTQNALFSIVQGGVDKEARSRHVETLIDLPVDGFSVGGLSVGEPNELMYDVNQHTVALLPTEKPRYLMGVGTPEDLVACVGHGTDMFDCVMPTRNGRNGMAFTWKGNIVVKHRAHVGSDVPLDADCACPTCQRFSRAYLCHLFKQREILCHIAISTHNLYFYLELMREMRAAILERRFGQFVTSFHEQRATIKREKK